MESIEKVITQMTARGKAAQNMTNLALESSKDPPIPEQTEEDKEETELLNKHSWTEPREGIECPICKNHETFFTVRQGHVYSLDCSCVKVRRTWNQIRRFGLEEHIKRCTFESYETPQPWQKEIKEIALRFVENPDRQWLLLAGQSGAGKTHLAVAAAFQLMLQGKSMYYMRWAESAPQLKANANNSIVYRDMIQPTRKHDILYIDDFWKCKKGQEPSDADVRLAFDILDYRYNNSGRITIISTEWTTEELVKIDEAIGGRIFEKTKGSQILVTGEEKKLAAVWQFTLSATRLAPTKKHWRRR